MNKETSIESIADIRREYSKGQLRRRDLPAEPIALFSTWLAQASAAQLVDPTAMCVATVDETGQPYQRIVLLKEYDEQALTFYTNLGSRKAQHLAHNAKISLYFPWHALDRQVMFLGVAEKVPVMKALTYFATRPRDSQLGAWASEQSCRISTRGLLEAKFLEMKQKFKQGEIPLPNFWGGYAVNFHTVEFWQGGEKRLHDRFLYQRNGASWNIDRLAP